MMNITKKLWLGIGILALISPLGIIIPKWFNAEGAWGEWGLEEIEKLAGFVPEGMKQLAEMWKAPLPDYTLPIESKGLFVESLGYVLSALIGIALVVGVMYIITKLLGSRKSSE
jgi:cobalt/nickel transport protein